MRPHVLLHRHSTVKSETVASVPASSLEGIPGYEEARLCGHATAVALRHRVKYQWMTRRPGCTTPVVYRQAEFLVVDDPPVFCPTILLCAPEPLVDRIFQLGQSVDGGDGGFLSKVWDAVRTRAKKALARRWENALVEVEVETLTVLSYDWTCWWQPVPAVLPASASCEYPILRQLEMEVYAESKERGAETCPICLGDFTLGMEVERLPCRHLFHGECLLRWLEMEGCCPLCRSRFPTN